MHGKREDAAEELGDRGEKLGIDALVQATADKEAKSSDGCSCCTWKNQ